MVLVRLGNGQGVFVIVSNFYDMSHCFADLDTIKKRLPETMKKRSLVKAGNGKKTKTFQNVVETVLNTILALSWKL